MKQRTIRLLKGGVVEKRLGTTALGGLASIDVDAKRKHCLRWPSVMEDRTLDLVCFIHENNCSHMFVLPNREISRAAFSLRPGKFSEDTYLR